MTEDQPEMDMLDTEEVLLVMTNIYLSGLGSGILSTLMEVVEMERPEAEALVEQQMSDLMEDPLSREEVRMEVKQMFITNVMALK